MSAGRAAHATRTAARSLRRLRERTFASKRARCVVIPRRLHDPDREHLDEVLGSPWILADERGTGLQTFRDRMRTSLDPARKAIARALPTSEFTQADLQEMIFGVIFVARVVVATQAERGGHPLVRAHTLTEPFTAPEHTVAAELVEFLANSIALGARDLQP